MLLAVAERILFQWEELGRGRARIDRLQESDVVDVDGQFAIVGHFVLVILYLTHRYVHLVRLTVGAIEPNGVVGVDAESGDKQLPNRRAKAFELELVGKELLLRQSIILLLL